MRSEEAGLLQNPDIRSHPAWADYQAALDHVCGLSAVFVSTPPLEHENLLAIRHAGSDLLMVLRWAPEPYLEWRQANIRALVKAMVEWVNEGHEAWPRDVRVVWKLLTQHSARSLDLGSMGSHLGTRPARLGDEFTRVTGLPFRQWLSSERCAHASRMLIREPQKTIGEISAACSPQSISQFNRNFLTFTGMNPRTFREAYLPLEKQSGGKPATPPQAGPP